MDNDNKIAGGRGRAHVLHIEKGGEQTKVTVSGVQSVIHMNEKAAAVKIPDGTLVVKGSGITLNKLSVEDGSLILEAHSVDGVAYSGGKGAPVLRRLFK